MDRLKYRILLCSSQEQQFPASELSFQHAESKGWQSQRFCHYPVEIIIQFYSPVRVRQLQVLSHQFKISSKIELFSLLPDLKQKQQSTTKGLESQFINLGYICLNSNERSHFNSRELKSAYLDAPSLYLKLLFHKNHLNKLNTFNQVGLYVLNIFGDIYLSNTTKNIIDKQMNYLNNQQNSNLTKDQNNNNNNNNIDSQITERIKVLEMAKQKAVQNEEYDQAKLLKTAIDKMTNIGLLIAQYEEKKAIAIANQDYDTAKLLKNEIATLRNAVNPQTMLNMQSNKDNSRLNSSYANNNNYQHQQHQNQQGGNLEVVDESRMYEDELQQSILELGLHNNNDDKINKNNINSNQIPFDERVIPTHAKGLQVRDPLLESDSQQNLPFGAGQQIHAGAEQQQLEEGKMQSGSQNNSQNNMLDDQNNSIAAGEQQKPQLSAENEHVVEQMAAVIPKEQSINMFSPKWNDREQFLKYLDDELKSPQTIKTDDQEALFHCYLWAISMGIEQSIQPVRSASINLLQSLLQKVTSKVSTKNEFPSYIEKIKTSLLARMSENNPRMKEQCEHVFMQLCGNPTITCTACAQFVCKGKKQLGSKQITARIHILSKMIEKYSVGNTEVPFHGTIEFILKQIDHSNNETRLAALDLFFQVYKVLGKEKVHSYLESVEQKHREIIETEIQAIESGGKQQTYKEPPKKKEFPSFKKKGGAVLLDKSDPKIGLKNKKKGLNQSQRNVQEKKAKKVCEFCGKVDSNFADSGKLNIHLWKECPMLLTCRECAQVVNISDLTVHRLNDCDNKKLFKACDKCKEAIKIKEFEQHTGCQVVNEGEVQCPLCQVKIIGEKEGWKRHLIFDGCSKNERSQPQN